MKCIGCRVEQKVIRRVKSRQMTSVGSVIRPHRILKKMFIDDNEIYLSDLSWNINDMGDELGLSDLHDIIKSNDMLGIVETMRNDTFRPQIPEYQTYHFACPNITWKCQETLVVYWYSYRIKSISMCLCNGNPIVLSGIHYMVNIYRYTLI